MKSYPFTGKQDLHAMQDFLKSLPQGTSIVDFNENIAMQRLAEKLGFELVSEKLWFSKEIKS